jgi:hypothetical protein
MFTWIPIHREAIQKLLEYRDNQGELLTILREMQAKGLKVVSLDDMAEDRQSVPLLELDPFTFFATFKRGKEHAIPLAYSKEADERFYIPENLHLIGMMNTADRSLAMVDYALRRRFRFINLRPEFSSSAFRTSLEDSGAEPELVNRIIERMMALNDAITSDAKNLGHGYQIGHSYFCPRKGIATDDDWYKRVIEAEIVPLIQEYWFDNEQRVKEHRSALLL